MNQTDIARLAERIRRGLPTLVIGSLTALPRSFEIVRIRCDLEGTLGPLERACVRIERLLNGGEHDGRLDLAERASGRAPIGERFVTTCNRLAARAPGGVALVLDAIDGADGATHAALARILRRPGTLLLPLVLVSRDIPQGTLVQVIDAMKEASLAGDATLEPAPRERAPRPPEAESIASLDPPTMRVLRASALVGRAFEADVVASLLGTSLDDVLESLQIARDAGVPLEDDESGHFEMPGALRDAIVGSILPSLRSQWHARLGEIFAERSTPDPLQSAVHLVEAGQHESALHRRLDAVGMVARAGDTERANALLAKVLGDLAALPGGVASIVRARVKLEEARIAWLGAGDDHAFPLASAFDLAIQARTELGEVAPPSQRADAASTVAGIAYDLGDGASLERAEKILNGSIASLVEDGAMDDAATLLNDQAAIALRMGQRLRALDLLGRSRELLTEHLKTNPKDTGARLDLAQTHHLLGRLPLHLKGTAVTAEAIAKSLEQLGAAEAIYRELEMRLDLGRVIETKARLLALKGDVAAARGAFDTAMGLADGAGDLTGLARITAGLAELLSSAGAPREALHMLTSSIELNREKGSPVGLAFDERVLDELANAVAVDPDLEKLLLDEIALTRSRLRAAIESTAI